MDSKKKPQAPKASTDLSVLRQSLASQKAPTIIHHKGQLNSVTVNGQKVHRSEYVWIHMNEVPKKIRCAPYDDHFVFRDPTATVGWTLQCTCGSAAGIVGWDAYKNDASAQGALLVCIAHATNGKHNDVNK